MKKILFGLLGVIVLCGTLVACDNESTAQQDEQAIVNNSYDLLIKVLPPPVFSWAFERYLYIKIYEARQHAVNTYAYELSPYTGKIIWGCSSMGYPIPGATQLTNPDQISYWGQGGGAVLPQPEPSGLFSPAEEAATWVPCVDANGNITPVYEENNITVFDIPMENNPNGFGIIPVPQGKEGYSIPISVPANINDTINQITPQN